MQCRLKGLVRRSWASQQRTRRWGRRAATPRLSTASALPGEWHSFVIISIHFYSFLFHIIWHMIWHMIWMRYDMKSDFHITLHNCIVFGLRVSEVLASSKHLGWWMGRQGVPTSAAWHFDSLWEVFPLCRRYVDRPWRLPHPHRLCGSGWP